MENLNFFEELYKSLTITNDTICNDNSNNIICKNDDNICMITQQPLQEHYIQLNCKHKFNYKPLYQEVYYQKITKPVNETVRLKINEFKCPYCRNIELNLLPPSPFDDLKNLKGVNHPLKYCNLPNVCDYILKSGKNKGEKCNKKCLNQYCIKHIKQIEKKEQKKQEQEQDQNKAEKSKKKTNKKTNNKSNIIKLQCNGILQSGKNKGLQCKNHVKIKNNDVHNNMINMSNCFCKLHKPK